MVKQAVETLLPLHDGAPVQHLIFNFESRLFGLPVDCVHAVALPGKLNKIPSLASPLAGLMNLQGETLAVLNSQRLFGVAAGSTAAGSPAGLGHLIIVSSTRGRFGLLVDKALKVLDLVIAPLPLEDAFDKVQTPVSRSYGVIFGEHVMVLSPEALGERSAS